MLLVKDKRKRIQDKEDLKLLEDSYDVKFSVVLGPAFASKNTN